jgi:hypothetical protein
MNKFLFALLFLCAVSITAAWAVDPPPIDPVDPDPVPVDGGASLLLVAGATYGARKLKALRKKK